jgi:hypothetical protein
MVTSIPAGNPEQSDYVKIGLSLGKDPYDLSKSSPDDALVLLSLKDTSGVTGWQLKGNGDGITCRKKPTPQGYAIELKIPFSELFTTGRPPVKSPLWLELAVCDVDNGPLPANVVRWSGVSDMSTDMSGFGLFRFLEKPLVNSSDPAVLRNTETLIFPNPTTGRFYINQPEEVKQLSVLNLNGKVMKILNPHDESESLDIKEFGSGLYVVIIQLKNGQTRYCKLLKAS